MELIKYEDDVYYAMLVENNERDYHLCYDRDYMIFSPQRLVNKAFEIKNRNDLYKKGRKISIRGLTKLPFEKIEFTKEYPPIKLNFYEVLDIIIAKPKDVEVIEWDYE